MNLFLTLALRPDSLLSSAPPANLHKYLLAFKFDQIVRSSLSKGGIGERLTLLGTRCLPFQWCDLAFSFIMIAIRAK